MEAVSYTHLDVYKRQGQVRMHGKVFSENYAEDGILLQGNLEIAYLSKVRDYVISHGIEH